ncbi:MAG: arginine N-succinyltransferase [SAR324 cluster bacterium]|uniref:Arginine N-succinyltransferase n=1 Tax=SAR324 cluster bacterium TaxID=2024889 RepID=A0A2A4T857_9DELT|nr:MAG: arginine N-succinyltransferase [SAR324 cluster bacterium]
MMIIRPAESKDLDALSNLAERVGVGFTSLPSDPDLIASKIERAEQAFSSEASPEKNSSYLFMLEDTDTGKIAGICGIESALGLEEPWYNFRMGTLVHSSVNLGVFEKKTTLNLSNDHTGYSELCTLFLDKDYRHSKNGSLLSKSRFMFLAAFPDRFHERVIAEMRGVSDEEGNSPFWEGLGRHFFNMDFAKADYLSGLGNKTFIAELMPKLPIYTSLLSKETQEVIGKVHAQTIPALKLLEHEGFCNEGYVDIFDGGATIEAKVGSIRAVKDCNSFQVAIGPEVEEGTLYLVSNKKLKEFRACLLRLNSLHGDSVALPEEMAAQLGIAEGDQVQVVPLSARS